MSSFARRTAAVVSRLTAFVRKRRKVDSELAKRGESAIGRAIDEFTDIPALVDYVLEMMTDRIEVSGAVSTEEMEDWFPFENWKDWHRFEDRLGYLVLSRLLKDCGSAIEIQPDDSLQLAIFGLDDQTVLEHLVTYRLPHQEEFHSDPLWSLRWYAIEVLTDRPALERVARGAATKSGQHGDVEDSGTVGQLAERYCPTYMRYRAAIELGDRALLKQVYESDPVADRMPFSVNTLLLLGDQELLVERSRRFLKPSEQRDILQNLSDPMLIAKFIAMSEIKYPDLDYTFWSILLGEAFDRLNDQAGIEYVALHASMDWVRQKAVEKLTDQRVLMQIALDERQGRYVRRGAIKRIQDQPWLEKLAKGLLALPGECSESEAAVLREAAVSALTNAELLEEILRNDPDESRRRTAASNPHLDDQALFEDLVRNDEVVRRALIPRLRDQSVLVELVWMPEMDLRDKQYSVEYLRDQPSLAEIAKKHPDLALCRLAMRRLTDRDALSDVYKNAADAEIRHVARRELYG